MECCPLEDSAGGGGPRRCWGSAAQAERCYGGCRRRGSWSVPSLCHGYDVVSANWEFSSSGQATRQPAGSTEYSCYVPCTLHSADTVGLDATGIGYRARLWPT